jgi:hypothetical protein
VPDCAKFLAEIVCPRCSAHLLNSVRCSWGAVPGAAYRLGDAIRWLHDQSGDVVRPFELPALGPKLWQWNCGSPDFANVELFDEDIYPGNHRLACSTCDLQATAYVASVRGGLVQAIRIVVGEDVDRILGASRDRSHVAQAGQDGSYTPGEDWFDHPVIKCSPPMPPALLKDGR